MNEKCETRGSSGVNVLWPDTSNLHFKEALEIAEEGGSPNNISAIISYKMGGDRTTAIWMGESLSRCPLGFDRALGYLC